MAQTRPAFLAVFGILIVGILLFSRISRKSTWTCREIVDAQGNNRNIQGSVKGTVEFIGPSTLVLFQRKGSPRSTGLFKLKDETGALTFYYVLGETAPPAKVGDNVAVRFHTEGIILSQGGKPSLFFFASEVETLESTL